VYLPRHEGAMQPDPPSEMLPARMHPAALAPDPARFAGTGAVSPAPPVAEPAGSSARKQQEPLPQTRGTLLLVEDEDAVRRLTARGLALAGWRVLAAESGDAALALVGAESEPPAVLVSDVSMPGMDGPTLVRTLRARLPSLPIILVSGYAESEAIADLPGAPVHFLPKPFTLKDLVARIDALVP
jgi:two-component system cell cycle sensor histidine kinase/response regulator CckA